jgi:hypothetical protein
MRKTLTLIALVTAAAASPLSAKEPCPPSKYGTVYPWAVTEIMSGDDYADIYLDIDKNGKPTNCRMGRNNIDGDNKFFVCKAFMEQWSTAAPAADSKTTIERKYIAYSEKHRKAERAGRKLFFQQHPEERPECYPEDE